MLPGIMLPTTRRGVRKQWLGSGVNDTNAATLSFGNFTVPAGGGLLVALITSIGADSRTVSSVSIGGSSGTLHDTHGASSFYKGAIASRLLAAGSHDVSLVLSGATGTLPRSFCGCWLLTGYASATPTFADCYYGGNSSLTIALTHDIPVGAAMLYGVTEISVSNPTWTAATEDGSATGALGHKSHWASRAGVGPASGYTETATFSSGLLGLLFMNAAVWA